MLDITILAVGKIKEKYCQLGASEYLKRLKPYAKIKIEELKNESFSSSNAEKAKQLEATRIQTYLSKQTNALVFLLAENGEKVDSYVFAEILKKTKQKVIFVIGGALGWPKDILDNYPRLSLSPLTFPHELARVILLEQLYRAVTIINNKTYHY